MKTRRTLIAGLLGTAMLACAFIALYTFGPQPQQKRVRRAVSSIETALADEGTFTPNSGSVLSFRNGEWLIIDLHYESQGFTVAYDSSGDVTLIVDYTTIYPAIEVWGSILHDNYDSIADFYEKNKRLNWIGYDRANKTLHPTN